MSTSSNRGVKTFRVGLGPLVILATLTSCNALFNQVDAQIIDPDAGSSDSGDGSHAIDAGGTSMQDATTAADAADASLDAVGTSDGALTSGPLATFEIVPFYYGAWAQEDVSQVQAYLTGLTQYITGANALFKTQTMLVPYGVMAASVHSPTTSSPAAPPLDRAAVLQTIRDAQTAGSLPAYSPQRVIVFIAANATGLTPGDCAYHGTDGDSRSYAVTSADCEAGYQSIARVVFDAAVDPDGKARRGLPPSGVPCSTSIHLWFGDIPGIFDEAQSTCASTAYGPSGELDAPGAFTGVWVPDATPQIQMNGATFAAFIAKSERLTSVGWRLHLLQPYVVNGTLLYSAVWRPGADTVVPLYGVSASEVVAKNTALEAAGMRLEILEPYVLSGAVLYSAVWVPASDPRRLLLDVAGDAFPTTYTSLHDQNWRIQTLRPYVTGGQTFYSAILRAGSDEEQTAYGLPFDQLKAKYDALWTQGWRLKTLAPFVLASGTAYSASWQRGDGIEWQVYDRTYGQYRSADDDKLTLDPQGRLEILGVVPP